MTKNKKDKTWTVMVWNPDTARIKVRNGVHEVLVGEVARWMLDELGASRGDWDYWQAFPGRASVEVLS